MTIDISAFTDALTDAVSAAGTAVPSILGAIVAVGVGLVVFRAGWNWLRRLVK